MGLRKAGLVRLAHRDIEEGFEQNAAKVTRARVVGWLAGPDAGSG